MITEPAAPITTIFLHLEIFLTGKERLWQIDQKLLLPRPKLWMLRTISCSRFRRRSLLRIEYKTKSVSFSYKRNTFHTLFHYNVDLPVYTTLLFILCVMIVICRIFIYLLIKNSSNNLDKYRYEKWTQRLITWKI